MEPIFLNKLDNFEMILHVIGYKNEGESIVFILKQGKNIYFSSVIDSYEQNNCNFTENLLKQQYNLAKLDYIFWTHPHEDHSLGLEDIISNYSSNKTVFITPQDIENSKDNLNDSEVNILEKMLMNAGKYKFQKTSVNDGGENTIYKRNFLLDSEEYTFTIKSLSPHSGVLEEIKKNKTKEVNDFSICLLFKISSNRGYEYSMLLTGDIENKTIRLLQDSLLKEVHFLKIPHHSSESASILPERIQNNYKDIMIACTTSYKKGYLPRENILKKYLRNYKNIFILGREKEEVNANYGVLTIQGSLKDFNFTYYLDGIFEEFSSQN